MNGLSILQFYCNGELEIEQGGFCNLATFTVKLDVVPSAEDRAILKEIGWKWETDFVWQYEEWS